MTAHTGRCRVQEDRVVVAVDVARHTTWEGSEQPRFFALDGDRLTPRTGVQEHPRFPGGTGAGTFTWARER
jgi:Lipocalin-like domain